MDSEEEDGDDGHLLHESEEYVYSEETEHDETEGTTKDPRSSSGAKIQQCFQNNVHNGLVWKIFAHPWFLSLERVLPYCFVLENILIYCTSEVL